MSHGDTLLHLAGIQGESFDAEHKDHIDVVAWSWGMASPTDKSTGHPYTKAQVNDFKIIKRADRSSPVLMQYLKENNVIKTAKLFVRKAGGAEALSYYEIDFKNVRITSFNAQFENSERNQGSEVGVRETVTLAFESATFKYTPQSKTGAKGGGTVEYTVSAYAPDR